MNSSGALMGDNPLYLDPAILQKLQTYDDFLSTFVQLEQASSSFSWLKADLLNAMTSKQGDQAVDAIAGDVRLPRSTVSNYIRTARAFPAEKRIANASFSLHYHASFADSYNTHSGEFEGARRFEWLEEAVDNNMSIRKLLEKIKTEKAEIKGTIITCQVCESAAGEIGLYILFSSSQKFRAEMYLHKDCRDEILIPLKVKTKATRSA